MALRNCKSYFENKFEKSDHDNNHDTNNHDNDTTTILLIIKIITIKTVIKDA